jgi:hypothetical protein
MKLGMGGRRGKGPYHHKGGFLPALLGTAIGSLVPSIVDMIRGKGRKRHVAGKRHESRATMMKRMAHLRSLRHAGGAILTPGPLL